MIKDLQALPIQIQASIVAASFLLLLFLLIILYKKGIRIKGKSINLSLDGENETTGKQNSSLQMIRKIWQHADERARLKYLQSTKLQMEQAEVFIQKYLQILMHVYLRLLQEKGFQDPVSTDSFSSYKNVLKVLEGMLLTIIRHAVRENNFAEKNVREFDDYVRNKIQQLADFCSNVLNDIYLYRVDINTSELYQANKAARSEFEQISNEFFFKCRQIAIEIKEKIEYLDNEDDKIFLNLKG